MGEDKYFDHTPGINKHEISPSPEQYPLTPHPQSCRHTPRPPIRTCRRPFFEIQTAYLPLRQYKSHHLGRLRRHQTHKAFNREEWFPVMLISGSMFVLITSGAHLAEVRRAQ